MESITLRAAVKTHSSPPKKKKIVDQKTDSNEQRTQQRPDNRPGGRAKAGIPA